MQTRIYWVDVARCFGMFAIFLGHFAEAAGLGYQFVYTFHNILFFFLSGCAETFNRRKIVDSIFHKTLTILLPFYFFGILFIAVSGLRLNTPEHFILRIDSIFRLGAPRATGYGGLWFLSCLYLMSLFFRILREIKNKYIILAICIGMYIARFHLFPKLPLPTGHWFYNLDSVFEYTIFYALGWILFDPIKSLLNSNKTGVRFAVLGSGFAAFAYSVCLFMGNNLLKPFTQLHWITQFIGAVAGPMTTIWLTILVAKACEKISIFQKLGESSLYLCGNESIVKFILADVFSAVGLTIVISRPLAAYVYSGILMLLIYRLFVPMEKKMVGSIRHASHTAFHAVRNLRTQNRRM